MRFSLLVLCLVAFVGINTACELSYPRCAELDLNFTECNSLLGKLLVDIGGVILDKVLKAVDLLSGVCSSTCGSGGDLTARLDIHLSAEGEADLNLSEVLEWGKDCGNTLAVIKKHLQDFIKTYKKTTKEAVKTKCAAIVKTVQEFVAKVDAGCAVLAGLTADVEVNIKITEVKQSCAEINEIIVSVKVNGACNANDQQRCQRSVAPGPTGVFSYTGCQRPTNRYRLCIYTCNEDPCNGTCAAVNTYDFGRCAYDLVQASVQCLCFRN
ncbi:unnamed protein product [Medioppia subpectinata]|uniref:Uncharacterized protein n=1 Tax=Medioppia subpectinata TaxID=1979941 RepID=A0A7R9KCF2_9ACAR|nr:unnamed protein product [Medioppia subpectinata]CAG2100921.1 unnamed protein product [Medioppia subpectinata]